MNTHEPLPVTIDDVRAAVKRVAGRVHRTPVLTSRTLDNATGARVFCKAENLQRTGAFKVRGAFNAIASRPVQERERAVVVYSSGNHAQAVALAARELGVQATVLMPKDAPRLKREATAGYGARVIDFDRYTESREQLAHYGQASGSSAWSPRLAMTLNSRLPRGASCRSTRRTQWPTVHRPRRSGNTRSRCCAASSSRS